MTTINMTIKQYFTSSHTPHLKVKTPDELSSYFDVKKIISRHEQRDSFI